MRKLVVLFIAMAIALSGIPASPLSVSPNIALASQPNSYAFTRTYYSDLAFKNGGEATVATGTKKRLELINYDGSIHWKSSNSKVASVTQSGTISAKRAGITRVTAKNLKTNRSVVCIVKVYKRQTQAQARKSILALKKTYYPGKRWTNKNYYYWQAANCHCFGCIAFVGIASDAAFGKYAPFKRHATFSKIKVGDHVRTGGEHSVIVLYKYKKSIIVAEGNYNNTFNWGRKISYAELKRSGFYAESRY